MPAFKKIVINGPQFFQTIIAPSFGELVEGKDVRNGYFGEFTVLDDVPYEQKILTLKGLRNILKRVDASCQTDYDKIMRGSGRKVSVTELGGAVQFCQDEFYQGCLKQWQSGDPLFLPNIVNFFKTAIAQDLISLIYFGDVARVEAGDPEGWNTNKIDGVYTILAKMAASRDLPSAQTMNIPNGDISASNAKAYLESMYKKMSPLMKLVPKDALGFYIDQEWADAYEDYLISVGSTDSAGVNFVQDGIKVRAYKGIPIFSNPFWNPILNQIASADAHFGVLTFRGNFIFATDKTYGAGPNADQALVVWYDYETDSWKWKTKMKAGTQVALIDQAVVAFNA